MTEPKNQDATPESTPILYTGAPDEHEPRGIISYWDSSTPRGDAGAFTIQWPRDDEAEDRPRP